MLLLLLTQVVYQSTQKSKEIFEEHPGTLHSNCCRRYHFENV